jgi:NADPH-dependent 2,4-dienoyl-CoA reductase/sulfur reductase-like enzyme
MRESTIEQYLIKRIKERGGLCIKLTGLVGLPDRLILLPVRIVIFIETKTATGKLSPLQKWWQKALTNLGFAYLIIRSKEEVNDLISQYDKAKNIL